MFWGQFGGLAKASCPVSCFLSRSRPVFLVVGDTFCAEGCVANGVYLVCNRLCQGIIHVHARIHQSEVSNVTRSVFPSLASGYNVVYDQCNQVPSEKSSANAILPLSTVNFNQPHPFSPLCCRRTALPVYLA